MRVSFEEPKQVEIWMKAMTNAANFRDRLTVEPQRSTLEPAKQEEPNGFIKVENTEEDEVISP